MKIFKFSLLFVCFLFYFNCQSQKFYFSDDIPPVPTKSGMTSHFFFGLLSSKESPIYGDELCDVGKDVAMVEFQSDLLDVFLSLVTYGIYTPKHYYLYCMEK